MRGNKSSVCLFKDKQHPFGRTLPDGQLGVVKMAPTRPRDTTKNPNARSKTAGNPITARKSENLITQQKPGARNALARAVKNGRKMGGVERGMRFWGYWLDEVFYPWTQRQRATFDYAISKGLVKCDSTYRYQELLIIWVITTSKETGDIKEYIDRWMVTVTDMIQAKLIAKVFCRRQGKE